MSDKPVNPNLQFFTYSFDSIEQGEKLLDYAARYGYKKYYFYPGQTWCNPVDEDGKKQTDVYMVSAYSDEFPPVANKAEFLKRIGVPDSFWNEQK